jgi:hypothetical protein
MHIEHIAPLDRDDVTLANSTLQSLESEFKALSNGREGLVKISLTVNVLTDALQLFLTSTFFVRLIAL